MGDSKHAWLLNLDAELELASAEPYIRRQSLARVVKNHLPDCSRLCRTEPVVGLHPVEPDRVVYLWCPTPSAFRELAQRGLQGVLGPSLGVLRKVNHRSWPLEFGPRFPGRSYLERGAAWREALLGGAKTAWRCKRPYGFAGRGQRCIGPDPSQDDVRWLNDSLRLGGLLIEPNVEVVREFSIHGYVDARGLVFGTPCSFSTDANGSPAAMELAEPDAVRDRALRTSVELVAARLRRADYFGPFGVDSFEYRMDRGLKLNALGEVNARFTLGWSLGVGSKRDAVLSRYARGR